MIDKNSEFKLPLKRQLSSELRKAGKNIDLPKERVEKLIDPFSNEGLFPPNYGYEDVLCLANGITNPNYIREASKVENGKKMNQPK